MTETRLFTVAKAATLIAKYTGQSKFDVAKDIEVAAWTHYAKPGHGKPLEVYTENGRRSRYRPGLYGYTLDPNITDPLEEKRVFTEYVPYLHLLVDLKEVLDALEYHPAKQADILAECDRAALAGEDAEGFAAVGVDEPVGWTLHEPERADVLRHMIYSVMKTLLEAGKPKPSAFEVMEAIQKAGASKFPEFIELTSDRILKYSDNGEDKEIDRAAMKKRIDRLIEKN